MNDPLMQPGTGTTSRRRLLGGGVAALALAGTGLQAVAQATRSASRARFALAADFATPPNGFAVVPWTVTEFQTGTDYTLQPDGRILINRRGLYEVVFSCDWDATFGTDIDLRRIGMRRQRPSEPDFPTEAHERIGFVGTPGSDAPRAARYSGPWDPAHVPLGGIVTVDVKVSPAGIVGAGDIAQAAHTHIRDGTIGAAAVAALQVNAKVITADTVRVSLYNPLIAEGIDVPAGTLRVLAMNTVMTRGSSGDTWQVLHSPSVQLEAGDKVYGLIDHKVSGSLLQATKGSYMQIDRLN